MTAMNTPIDAAAKVLDGHWASVVPGTYPSISHVVAATVVQSWLDAQQENLYRLPPERPDWDAEEESSIEYLADGRVYFHGGYLERVVSP